MNWYSKEDVEKMVKEAEINAINLTADAFKKEFGNLVWSNGHMSIFTILAFLMGAFASYTIFK